MHQEISKGNSYVEARSGAFWLTGARRLTSSWRGGSRVQPQWRLFPLYAVLLTACVTTMPAESTLTLVRPASPNYTLRPGEGLVVARIRVRSGDSADAHPRVVLRLVTVERSFGLDLAGFGDGPFVIALPAGGYDARVAEADLPLTAQRTRIRSAAGPPPNSEYNFSVEAGQALCIGAIDLDLVKQDSVGASSSAELVGDFHVADECAAIREDLRARYPLALEGMQVKIGTLMR